jgi:replicative DNA helicase
MEYDSAHLAFDSELESNVLGALLVIPGKFKSVVAETKLNTKSFYHEKNQKVFETILKLSEEAKPADEMLVSSHLNGTVPQGYVGELAANCPAAGSVMYYAERVVELSQWRDKRLAALDLVNATKERDFDAFAKAKLQLESGEIRVNSVKTPEQLGEEFNEYMNESMTEAFKLPYKRFNERMGGGLRRKQMTVLGGWSSHGKSVVMDQMLEYMAKGGANCHLYINEMGREDRVARSIARNTGISYQRLVQGRLSDKEKHDVAEILEFGCPYFSITECAGWSIQELAYDIKSREYDVIGVDILHLFDYDSENELAKISRLLNRTAKQGNCHIIATVHLNEYRVNDVIRPRPVMRDIRGSGMIKNDADNVMFIYREQEPGTGDPLPPSALYTSKIRNGQMGTVHMTFNEDRFMFEESDY